MVRVECSKPQISERCRFWKISMACMRRYILNKIRQRTMEIKSKSNEKKGLVYVRKDMIKGDVWILENNNSNWSTMSVQCWIFRRSFKTHPKVDLLKGRGFLVLFPRSVCIFRNQKVRPFNFTRFQF